LYTGRYQEAQHYLERAVAVNPAWFYAQSNLAVVLDVQDKREEAIQQYERALRVVPPDRRDSIPRIRERISQLRNDSRGTYDRELIRREMLD
jgi:tetratricopeptide (TPR) repeat protein